MDVADWLRGLGLERYEATFRENDVSADVLRDLTAEDLKELGVASVGHRRQLLVAIAKLKRATSPLTPITRRSSQRPPPRDRSTKMPCRTVANAASSP